MTYALRPPRLGLYFFNHVVRGPQRRSRTIERSIQLIVEITDIAEIISSNPRIRRRRDCSIALPMKRNGARSIILLDTIWNSAKLFWIIRRCHHQHQWPKNPVEANIAEPIPTTRIKWGRSMCTPEVACPSPRRRKERSLNERSAWLSASS
jgi:hypothetical protein